jgi:hypothetical protein
LIAYKLGLDEITLTLIGAMEFCVVDECHWNLMILKNGKMKERKFFFSLSLVF